VNRGRFDKKTGSVQFDKAAKTGKVELTIDATSINTGTPAFDKHLQSADLFDTAKYPTITFAADKFVFNGDKVSQVTGTLTLMGKTNPDAGRHEQQSMIVVPANSPGITVVRALSVFGYDDAPHGHMEVLLKNVRVPAENILLGEGRGFEIAQGRLGPGRIHHCMRTIGIAERALELMCKRLNERVAFGREVARQTVWQERIAESRCMIEQARLLTLKAAHMMDTVGNKVAKAEIAMIKIVAPNMACQIIDWAIQAHGGGGVSQDFPLAYAYAHQRTLRLADGPDEVHRNSLAKLELAKQLALPGDLGMPITRGS
jgi:acyl-CoA dehydrogenase